MRRWFFALVVALLTSMSVRGLSGGNDLAITFFKAGKADAFLFLFGGYSILLDAGEADDAEDILAYAQEMGVTTLDLVILTHFDQGHIGGMPEIIGTLSVGRIILPDTHKDNNASQALYKALMQAGITPEYVHDPITMDHDALSLTLYPAKRTYEQQSDDDHDDASLVASVTHGQNRLLFSGDIRSARMEELVSGETDLRHAFLKVPAHGRAEAAFPRFLDAVSPGYAVITCSDKNPPADAVLDALAARNTQVWLTKDGDITLTSDGQAIMFTQ